LRRLLAVCAVALCATACTPEEINAYMDFTRDAREGAEAKGLTPERLHALVDCESGADPTAVSPTGRYRGLGQFDRRTWDGVASRWAPALEGVDPTTVPYYWQIYLIWALWSERGSQPWTCA
jgi:hypothetical protein